MDTKELIYEAEIDTENRLVVAKTLGEGLDWEFRVRRCKLLCVCVYIYIHIYIFIYILIYI